MPSPQAYIDGTTTTTTTPPLPIPTKASIPRKARTIVKDDQLSSSSDEDDSDGEWRPLPNNNTQQKKKKKRRNNTKTLKSASSAVNSDYSDDEIDSSLLKRRKLGQGKKFTGTSTTVGRKTGDPLVSQDSPQEPGSDNSPAPTNETPAKPYKCVYPGCGKAYTKPSRLAEHELVHTGERPFQCMEPGCNAAFRRETHFATHVKIHSSRRDYQCPYPGCAKAFYNQDKLNRHFLSHDTIDHLTTSNTTPTAPSGTVIPTRAFQDDRIGLMDPETILRLAEEMVKLKPYACTVEGCSKRFSKHQKLKAHVCLVHEGTKPYPCTHEGCEKSFNTPSKLRKHVLVHSDALRYGCGYPDCGAVFSKWSLLQKHTKTFHKSMACSVCGKVILKNNLKAHLKVHDSNRPQVPCLVDGCTKVFSTERTLATHVKAAHQAAKPFGCDFQGCGKRFEYKHVLERHFKRVHLDPPPKPPARKTTRKDAIPPPTALQALVGYTEEETKARFPIACEFESCGRRFTTVYLMQRHLESREHEMDFFPEGKKIEQDDEEKKEEEGNEEEGEGAQADGGGLSLLSLEAIEDQAIRDMIDLNLQGPSLAD